MAKKIPSGLGTFSGLINQDFVFLVILPNAAFEDLVKDLTKLHKNSNEALNNGEIVVWETFTATGVGKLIRCETSINAKNYIQILEKGLLPSVQKLGISHNLIFQHDVPAHTAKETKKWLAGNSIDVMSWPGQSPDLNLIENSWAIISRDLAGKTFPNKEKFWKAAKK